MGGNMISSVRKHWYVWWTASKLSASATLSTRGSALMFLLGKFIRFFFFIYFIFILTGGVRQINNYPFSTMLTFFLIFNLFDLIAQLFFRGIYFFRQQVISGEFDFRLVKPVSPLFQALTRHTDILDIPLLFIVIIALIKQSVGFELQNILTFFLVSITGLIIITAIHIAVAALGVITTEIDHTIMIYRDISSMARFPIDIYTGAIRALLTFVIPIALAFTFPAKALLGVLTLTNLTVSIVGSIVFLFLSLKLWKYALMQYSSASS